MPVTDLLTLDEAKAQLNQSSSIDDEELQEAIDEATEIVEDLTGPIIPRTVVDTFRGSSGRTLVLSQAPVLSVTSAVVSSYGTTSQTYLTAALDLNAVTGEVRVLDGTRWAQDVTVTYTAGRSSVPACVRRAMKELVRHMWETQRGDSGGRPVPGYDADITQTPSGFLVPNRVAEAVAPVARAPRVA